MVFYPFEFYYTSIYGDMKNRQRIGRLPLGIVQFLIHEPVHAYYDGYSTIMDDLVTNYFFFNQN